MDRAEKYRSVRLSCRRPLSFARHVRCVARGADSDLHFVYTSAMGAEQTTTVRVRRPDSERLQSLAKSRQTSVVEIVHSAIDALERQEYLRGLGDDYRRLSGDPVRFEEYLAERREWDPLG